MYTYKNIRVFDDSFPFLKGNLHGHTTLSDGRLTTSDVIQNYKAAGYTFIAITDHEIYTDFSYLGSDDFVILPAIECACAFDVSGPYNFQHHVNGIMGTKEMLAVAPEPPVKHMTTVQRQLYEGGPQTVQKMRQYLTDRGNFCIYNHPRWSQVTPEEIGDLEGFSAIDIYNNNTAEYNHMGNSVLYWDILLQTGRKINAVAVDDSHNDADTPLAPDDSFGGWVAVNAGKVDHESITAALISGQYYSSNGPSLYNYGVKDGYVFAECSPVKRICFVAGGATSIGGIVRGENGCDVTQGTYKLTGKERYVRIECIDENGKTAWSNPLYGE